jgi:hypothetical protein
MDSHRISARTTRIAFLVILSPLAHAQVDTSSPTLHRIDTYLAKEPFIASVNTQLNVMAPPYNAKGDCVTDDQQAITAALRAADAFNPPAVVYFPKPPGGCYLTSTLTWYGESLLGQPNSNPGTIANPGVLIKGQPGQDILHAPDPTTTASFPWHTTWSIRDIAFQAKSTTNPNFPHRWPGHWFDDARMTAGSAVLTTSNGKINCDDVGQAIQVNGASSGASNLVTTVASVTPCWMTSAGEAPGVQTITLAATASTTVVNAHTYMSLLGLPVTATISNCDIAMDDMDGKTADWIKPTQSAGNGYDEISNVQFQSNGSFTNNQCGFFSQGAYAPYALHVDNFTIADLNYGVVQVMAELNSYNQAGGGNDLQTWDKGSFFQVGYPWIMYNGSGGSMRSIQSTSCSGFQFLQAGQLYAEQAGYWHFEGAGTGETCTNGTPTTYGTRLEGSGYTGDSLTLGAPGMTGYIGASDVDCRQCNNNGSTTIVNGHNNVVNWTAGGFGASITDNGIGNRINVSQNPTGITLPYVQSKLAEFAKQEIAANYWNTAFINTGNAANPFANPDALFLAPQEVNYYANSFPYATTVVQDSGSVPTGYYLDFPSGRSYTQFQQASVFRLRGGNIVVGSTMLPVMSYTAYLWAKCPSGTNSLTWLIQATNGAGSSNLGTTGSVSCTTSYALYSIPITTLASACSGSCAGYWLNFKNNGSAEFQAGWIALRPHQGDYNGFQPSPTPVNNAVTAAKGGSGTGTVTCLTATCTNISGSYSVVGGTFTTGNFLVLVWPTTTAVYKCWTSQNGGVTSYGIGHSVATATGMTITNAVSVAGVTVTVDYGCSQY